MKNLKSILLLVAIIMIAFVPVGSGALAQDQECARPPGYTRHVSGNYMLRGCNYLEVYEEDGTLIGELDFSPYRAEFLSPEVILIIDSYDNFFQYDSVTGTMAELDIDIQGPFQDITVSPDRSNIYVAVSLFGEVVILNHNYDVVDTIEYRDHLDLNVGAYYGVKWINNSELGYPLLYLVEDEAGYIVPELYYPGEDTVPVQMLNRATQDFYYLVAFDYANNQVVAMSDQHVSRWELNGRLVSTVDNPYAEDVDDLFERAVPTNANFFADGTVIVEVQRGNGEAWYTDGTELIDVPEDVYLDWSDPSGLGVYEIPVETSSVLPDQIFG